MYLFRKTIKGCSIAILLLFPGKIFAQAKQDSVIVLPVQVAAPPNAKKIGTIKIGDNALAVNCNYEELITEAKDKARSMGGNIAKITELASPVFISKCYGIKVDIYHADTLPHYIVPHPSDIADTTAANYALLYIYRLKDTLALEPSYDLHLNNDSVIAHIKNKTHKAVKIYDTGIVTLWAKNAQRQELKLNVKPGGTYYLRCGLIHGEIMLIPFIELVDQVNGAYEYEKLSKEKKAGVGLEYLKQIH